MNNIILTGMSGSGKSTIGKRLAEVMKMNYIDFDELLEQKGKMSVGALLRSLGDDRFIIFERDIAMTLNVENTVISLSGSVCLIEEVMTFLRKNGVSIFIDTPLSIIKLRLENMKLNRIIGMEDRTIDDIYYGRVGRYKIFADYTFDNSTKQNPLGVFTDFLKFFKSLKLDSGKDISS